MKKKSTLIVTLILLFSFFIPGIIAHGDNKDYKVSSYNMYVDIKENGDAYVKENITYDFKGEFNGVLRNIDRDRSDGVENLKILVGDREISNYETKEEGSILKLKIYEKSKSEQKTFTYSYVLKNVAEKYNDISTFNRKIIDKGWDVPLENINIKITIPEGANKNDLRVFAHGPLNGASSILDNRTFNFTVPFVNKGDVLETFILFPKDLIRYSTRIYNVDKLNEFLDKEKGFAEEANRMRERERERLKREEELRGTRNKLAPLFFGGIGAGISSLLYMFKKFGGDLEPEFKGEYYRDLPGDYTPAIMSYLVYNRSTNSEDIMATIMDLVRKRKIKISSVDEEGKRGKIKTKYKIEKINNVSLDSLYPHERFIIKWFIDHLGDGESVILDNIKQKLKKKSAANRFNKDYDTFKELVNKEGEKKNFFGQNKANGKEIFYTLGFIIAIAFGVLAIILKSAISAVAAGLGVIIIVAMAFLSNIKKKTRFGVEENAKWMAFKKFLRHFSNMDKADIPSIVIWEHYLVYAISLGVAEEVIEKLPKIFKEEEFNDPSLTYMGLNNSFYNYYMISSMISDTTTIVDTAIDSAAVATSQDSSTGGFGGGFSGGSSGGGGGGGGGGAF
ncbi:DUF2207 domain-containing protein [Clostridium hydrogeniformans]|uniref:DUF2207 domain-containing protein n=1 Tax=Clostridium hydrogeniformans TaxID=349933 RepID=UPI00048A1457|nr:DUF2207 domain-containing protein [Clostridium hydrogeniformans]